MTRLVVRKIPWDFDATVPFMWQPNNPNFGLFCNAQDRLEEDPEIASEADAFLRQEAQHAAAHRKHMIALTARYPELERCYEYERGADMTTFFGAPAEG
jgi:predicted metal-dependent hydrolase